MSRNRFTGRVVVFGLVSAAILAFMPAPAGDFDFDPPRCRRIPSESAQEVLGAGADDFGIDSVSLSENADNVGLEVGEFEPGVSEVQFRMFLVDTSAGGRGTVTVFDTSGNACTLEADFRGVPSGPVSEFEICSGDTTSLVIDNASATPPGPSACSVNEYTTDEPALPPGYEPAPPFSKSLLAAGASEVLTIDSPIEGETRMTLTVDVPFDPRLRLLLSSEHEPELSFGTSPRRFVDVTRSVSGSTTASILIGCGQWSTVKVTFGLQSEICNGLDDDEDGDVDEGLPVGGPPVDDDEDGFPLCPESAGGTFDCNDQQAFVHPGALEICNGLDDDCDGEVDDDCIEASRSLVSIGTDRFVNGATRRQQDVQVIPGTAGPLETYASFLPGFLGLDGVDVLPGGDLLFSVRANGGVHHAGGFAVLRQDRIYRYERGSGTISKAFDWELPDIGTLDAFDVLHDGSLAFSTESLRGVRHAGGYIVLRPENAYRFDPATGTFDLLFDGRLAGLPDLDGLSVLSSPEDGTGILHLVFSTATNRLIHTPNGVLYLKQQNAYAYDARTGDVTLALDGEALGLPSLDAISLTTETSP